MTSTQFQQELRTLIVQAHQSEVPSAMIVGTLAIAVQEQGFMHCQATQQAQIAAMADQMSKNPPTN